MTEASPQMKALIWVIDQSPDSRFLVRDTWMSSWQIYNKIMQGNEAVINFVNSQSECANS